MKITSMSNRELLETLAGYGFAGVSSEVREIIESSKAPPKSIWTKDRFESSDSVVFEGSLSGNGKKTDRFEYSDNDDIDFNDKVVQYLVDARTQSDLIYNSGGGIAPKKEVIADHFGKIAKRLDEAYEAGKFTKEEYDYLNEGILERMEHYISCAERSNARSAIMCKRLNSIDYCKRANSMTGEEFRAELKEEIDAYVEKYFKINRKVLMQMFNNVRYAKPQKPTEKVFLL